MIKKTIFRNQTAKDTFVLYAAIIINILLGWVITKLNTKYLTVAEYGQYAFFIAILYYSQSFFSLGFFESTSRLLALQNDYNSKRELFGGSLLVSFLLFIPLIIFFIIFSFFTDTIFEVKIGYLCLLFAAFSGLIIIHAILIVTLRGSGDITKLSFITFFPRVFYLLILMYLIYSNHFTLINTLIAFFVGLFIAISLVLNSIKPVFKNYKQRIRDIINETKSYGIFIYFGNILNESLKHSDKIIISYLLTAEELAYYSLAYILTYPLSHFSNSLATSMFNRFASVEKINQKIIKINLSFIFVSVLIFVGLREFIIVRMFSLEYLNAVAVMLPLAIAFGFSGLTKPFTLYLMVKGQGRQVKNISIVILVVNVCLNLILIKKFGIIGAGWAACAAYILDFILYWFSYYKFQNQTLAK